MRFNERIAGIGAGAAALVYMLLPNINEEGRFDQIITFTALWAAISLLVGWVAYELQQIKKRRDSLKIVAKRPNRGNRDNLRTDIRLKRKSWVITFPVEERVTD